MNHSTTPTEPARVGDLIASIGVGALALHMAEHELPIPLLVDFGDHEHPALRVRLRGVADQDRWLASVHVDRHDTEPTTPGVVRVTWHVRLPDTGTRVQLVGQRLAGMAVVPQGVPA